MSDRFKKYGWKVNETNLNTLPPSAPKEAKDLAKWLTLEGRRSSLVEWIGCVQDDGRIHGKFWGLGAWTHRMAHSKPNQANIMSEFKKEPGTAVEEVKKKYDGRLRECFKVPEGRWLVGCDAEGIQLRVLAHLMKSEQYRDAIVSGVKEKETDIHNVNKRALDLEHIDRDDAKTFIYAWVLGAGLPKVASILKTTTAVAKAAEQKFLDSIPELKRLKEIDIKRDALRGYFIGLDGRKVKQKSEHLMLAGYLQNGESVIMKRATLLWYQWAKDEGIDFKLVDLVHDEWQTEVNGTKEQAERIGELQCKALEQVGEDLKLLCPLKGEYRVGKNWRDTH